MDTAQSAARTLHAVEGYVTELGRFYRDEVASALDEPLPPEVRLRVVARCIRIAKLHRKLDLNGPVAIPESLDPSLASALLRVLLDSMVCATSSDPAIRALALDRAGLESREAEVGLAAWLAELDLLVRDARREAPEPGDEC